MDGFFGTLRTLETSSHLLVHCACDGTRLLFVRVKDKGHSPATFEHVERIEGDWLSPGSHA